MPVPVLALAQRTVLLKAVFLMVDYKRQHTVAKSYLRGFVRENAHGDTLVQYDKQEGTSCLVKPADASIWKFGYSFKNADGSWNNRAEENLSKIESKAMPVIRKLNTTTRLSSQERINLALFLMSSLRRPRTMMEAFTDAGLSESKDPRWKRKIIESLERGSGKKFTSEEKVEYTQIVEEMQEKQRRDEVKARQLSVWFELLPDHATRLMSINWKILLAKPPLFFVTSDSPAYTRLIGDPDHKASEFVRMGDPEVEFAMPLSQSHMLLARHVNWSDRLIASKSRVAELNSRTIRMAHRFVWSPTQTQKVESLFQRFKDHIPPLPDFQSMWQEGRE